MMGHSIRFLQKMFPGTENCFSHPINYSGIYSFRIKNSLSNTYSCFMGAHPGSRTSFNLSSIDGLEDLEFSPSVLATSMLNPNAKKTTGN